MTRSLPVKSCAKGGCKAPIVKAKAVSKSPPVSFMPAEEEPAVEEATTLDDEDDEGPLEEPINFIYRSSCPCRRLGHIRIS